MKRLIPAAFGIFVLAVSVPCVSAERQRDMVRFGRDLVIEQGTTVHDAVAIGGNLTVNGAVEHDAVSVGGSVTLNEGASVGNNTVALGGSINNGAGAPVGGDTVEIAGGNFLPRDLRAFFAALAFLSLLSFLVLGILVAALFPKQVSAVADAIGREPGRVALWGIIGAMLIVPVALLLAVTVVGIMLIPLELVLVVIASIVGYIAAAAFVGRKALNAMKRTGTLIGETVLGMALLALAGFVPLIGWFVTMVALLTGFGAVLDALFRRREPNPGQVRITL